jgi:type II secretory pathway component PulC
LTVLTPLPAGKDGLIDRRFTRRVAGGPPIASTAKAPELSLDRLIKLTGILDFAGKQPTLAVIETPSESKAYKAGDKVGETGVTVKDVKDYVVIEYEKRRFKVTFLGIQELPSTAVGKD